MESTRELIKAAKECHREAFGYEPAPFQQLQNNFGLHVIANEDDDDDEYGDQLCLVDKNHLIEIEDENDDLRDNLLAYKCLLKTVRQELFDSQRRNEHLERMNMDLSSENDKLSRTNQRLQKALLEIKFASCSISHSIQSTREEIQAEESNLACKAACCKKHHRPMSSF